MGISEDLIVLIVLLIFVAIVAGYWKMFEKAGEPGWAAIIPIYNIWVHCRIVGLPGWYAIAVLLVGCIPLLGALAQFAFFIYLGLETAKAFGRSAGFGVGVGLLSFVFIPILGFGDAEYLGPGGTGAVEPSGYRVGGSGPSLNKPQDVGDDFKPWTPPGQFGGSNDPFQK